jgi:hypothetical protein
VAFSDPETITVNAVAQTLARVASGTNAGSLQTSDGNFRLDISHSYGGSRNRHTLAVRQRKIAADPLISAQNAEFSMSFRVTVDVPNNQGFTIAEQKLLTDGVITWLQASSGAKMSKLMGGEN